LASLPLGESAAAVRARATLPACSKRGYNMPIGL